MLNELYELSRSLEHNSLLVSTTHPNISNMGKKDCLLFELDVNGNPRWLRFFPKKEMPVLWKHSKGNHNSFPAICVRRPLLCIEESWKFNESVWKKATLTEKVELLSRLDFSAVNPECDDIKISEWSIKELMPVLHSEQTELAALKNLLSVFPTEEQSVSFLEKLLEFINSWIKKCNQENLLDHIKELLIGHSKSSDGKYITECMTYFDMYDTENFHNLVFSNETRAALVKLLNHTDAAKNSDSSKKKTLSPFTGEEIAGILSKYPNPNIPLLGLTYLYSKKADIPCLSRYTMTGIDAFQAGKAETDRMNDALAFLTQESRKNKTWRAMSNSNHDKPDLLLAYLTEDPQNDALLAKVLGNPSDYDDLDEYREEAIPVYEALCKQVLGKLEDVLQKNPNSKVNLILLETLDTGRKQVEYETVFAAERLCENMKTWNKASQNGPQIEIKVWDKKEIVSYKPLCPGPDGICRLLKMNFSRSGTGIPMKQSEVSFHEIYNLYMPGVKKDRSKELIDRFLRLAVWKSLYLLANVGGEQIEKFALPSTGRAHTQAKQAAMFISLFFILLYFEGIRKENYMFDVPFNVGQFVKLADMLHKEYTIQVRNNGNKQASLPPQLMGNEMLPVVAERPIEGLNRLRERMRIYLAWAYTSVSENSRFAKWILARFEEVSLKIAAKDLPEYFNEAQQAQVLLGYLAEIPYEKKNDPYENNKKGEKPNE